MLFASVVAALSEKQHVKFLQIFLKRTLLLLIGAVGAAACIAVGMGLVNSMKDVKKLIPVKTTYHPNTANRAAYERNFKVFKNLYKCNKQNFAILNGQE